MTRCRLCTANDPEALTEQLARQMWESRRDREIDPDWDNASPYWQLTFREFAAQTIRMLSHSDG